MRGRNTEETAKEENSKSRGKRARGRKRRTEGKEGPRKRRKARERRGRPRESGEERGEPVKGELQVSSKEGRGKVQGNARSRRKLGRDAVPCKGEMQVHTTEGLRILLILSFFGLIVILYEKMTWSKKQHVCSNRLPRIQFFDIQIRVPHFI